jgi:DNA-binding transcriptional LysR family regulator
MNITLRQLYGFKTVADVGTFTAAAHRLKIAQPALSLNIRDLEKELGARLFDRTTRRVELTAAGREFLQSVDKLINDLELAVANTRHLAERKRGRLVVGAPPLLAAFVVPGAVADYKKNYPAIDVSIVDTQTDYIIEKVRSGEADCGIGTFDEAEEGLRREVVCEDSLMAWCPPQSQLMRSGKLAWKDLPVGQLISLTRESRIRFLVEQACLAAGHPIRPAYEVSHVTTAIMMVEAGLGIAVLPAYASGFARAFNVVSKVLSEPEVRREISLIYSGSRALTPAAEAFLRFLRKRVRAAVPRGLRQSGR